MTFAFAAPATTAPAAIAPQRPASDRIHPMRFPDDGYLNKITLTALPGQQKFHLDIPLQNKRESFASRRDRLIERTGNALTINGKRLLNTRPLGLAEVEGIVKAAREIGLISRQMGQEAVDGEVAKLKTWAGKLPVPADTPLAPL